MFCRQRETLHRQQWQSWKAHENVEEMGMATVQIEEYVQTMGMGKQAATVVLAGVIATGSVTAIAI